MSETKKISKPNPLIDYFQGSFQEIRKVTWPTRQQAVRMTLLVIGFCLVAAIILGALDFVFNFGYHKLVEISPAGSQTSLLDQIPVGQTTPTTTTGSEVPVTAAPVGDVTATTSPTPAAAPAPAPAAVQPPAQPTGTQQ